MTTATIGHCHCGAVEIAVASPPTTVTECHCSLCRRYAALWAYYKVDDVTLTGPTDNYMWGRKHLLFQRCASCGCVMRWTPRGDYPECGVNARMLDGFDPGAVTLIVEDDASV